MDKAMHSEFEGWTNAENEKPEYNVSVLVFIPEEDEHITTGMWDIDDKWVLLDEYRVPTAQVTYWRPMVEKPSDRKYTPTFNNDENDTTDKIIRNIQKENQSLRSELQKQKDEFNYMRNSFHQLNKRLMDDLVKQRELNAELVDVLEMFFEKDRIPAVHGAMPVALRSFRERAEDLIKKSKES